MADAGDRDAVRADAPDAARRASPAMMAATSGSSDDGEQRLRIHRAPHPFSVSRSSTLMRAPLAEQHDQDRKADGRFRRRDGEHEEHEHLAADVAQVAREGDEVEIGREQQQLDAHQEQDDILAVDEDARHRERKQDPGERQELRERDHGASSADHLDEAHAIRALHADLPSHVLTLKARRACAW